MTKFLCGIALACLLPLLAAPAWAGFREGADAYKKGDYQTALNEWMPLAQGGNAEAQNAVGAMYDNGLGVVSDEAEAFKWYSLAADQNYPLAMRNLGTMYATGHGVSYSLQQAQLWLGRAAGAGDQVAGKRLAALPPVGTGSAEPVITPLAPVGSAPTTTTQADNGFGSATGPSSLLAQTAQPATAAPAAPAVAPAATAAATTASGATTVAPVQPEADQSAATSPALTFPAANVPAAVDASQTVAPATAADTTAAPAATTVATAPATATTTTATDTAAPAATGTAADGWRAFDLGDYKAALGIWEPLAQDGDSNLQVLVGSLYDYGQGVPPNKPEALKWYLMAAEKGSGRGQYAAGAVLAKDTKQRNLVEAYKWLTVAGDTLRGQGGDVAASQALSLRQQIAKEMNKDDIDKAETMAQAFHAS